MTKNTLNNTEQSAQSGIKIYLRNGLYFVLFLMAVQLLTTLTGGGLTALGIEPRTVNGLFGIFLAPFIHRLIQTAAFPPVRRSLLLPRTDAGHHNRAAHNEHHPQR